MIPVKILSYKSPQRYAVKQTLRAALNELRIAYPGLEVNIEEVKHLDGMERYTPVVILPSLVVNERLVCVGRFPRKDEVVGWLRDALEASAG